MPKKKRNDDRNRQDRDGDIVTGNIVTNGPTVIGHGATVIGHRGGGVIIGRGGVVLDGDDDYYWD